MEALAASIFADAPMAIVALDEAGVVCCANATAERFFGCGLNSPNAIIISDLIEGFDTAAITSPSWAEDINACGRSSGNDHLWRAHRADGVQAFIDIQAKGFTGQNGRFVTLFIQDMTNAVAAESALQELRLQIIHDWRLNSLGEVAAMISHEVNQPLCAAINYIAAAHTAITQTHSESAASLLGSARTQVERVSDIIQRLRALMIQEKGFHAREAVCEVIEEILPILHAHARETGAEVVARLDPAEFTYCDRVQLQQVVINLARNAMEAPSNGLPRKVEISGRQTPEGYQILVCDNGPGVPPMLADKLFEPLVSSKLGGMGLGLSICRTIVQAHGGEIGLTPSPLGGAGFAFTLNTNTHAFATQGDTPQRSRHAPAANGRRETDDGDEAGRPYDEKGHRRGGARKAGERR